jgi:hypothetical protein
MREGEMRGTYRILVGKSEGKRPFERSRRRRLILKYIIWKFVRRAWTGLM